MHQYNQVLVQKEGSLLILTINRPDSNNRINRETGNEMIDVITKANDDSEVKVIIITGTGEYFCGGGDIDNYPQGPLIDQKNYTDSFWGVHEAIYRSRKPILGAIQGHAIAGGFSITEACDMAFTGKSCMFGMPEIERALFPMVALATTGKNIPKKKLLEICFTAKKIDAETAKQLYLVNEVVADDLVLEHTKKVAREISEFSGAALAFGREAYYRMNNMSLSNALEYSRVALLGLLCTEDAKNYAMSKINGTSPMIKNY